MVDTFFSTVYLCGFTALKVMKRDHAAAEQGCSAGAQSVQVKGGS